MAVAAPRTPATPTTKSLPLASKRREEKNLEWWVEPIKWVALVVFLAVPLFAHLERMQPYAGRIVWTMVVAALPLFIVLVGYHRWRRICPLAFFSQIPVRLRRPGVKKASAWLEANYYYVAFVIFFVSLWIRLIATNGDGHAIAAFFVLIAMAALIFGAFYTGKTWCNYICPLSFIEKIYTEPHGLRETQNSQCAKCTACKKLCPDINEENGYWKEIASNPKRFVYFAFPGVVFGFYFYYYLQSGTWSYYFGSPSGVRWVNEPMMLHWAFLPGHNAETAGFFFLPVVPRALASILTLAVCGLVTYFLLRLAERYVGAWLKHRDAETDDGRVRHVMFSVAAFLAFITFYSFAGAPTLWKAPWVVPQLFVITVVLTATLFLARRLRRTQKGFAEETLAKNIIKRWEWTDITPPKDLREAFIIHTIKTKESAKGSAQVLEIYKDAVREAVANGFVTREEVQLLESLRSQLQIKKSDHDKVMEALAEEERAMFADPSKQISAEKRLQLETYEHALRSYLEGVFASDGAPDDRLITQLRSEYRVTRDEHAAVLDEILGGSQGIAARLAEEISSIERAAKTIQALELQPTPTHDFLMALLRRRRVRALDRLMRGLSFTLNEEEGQAMRAALLSSDDTTRKSVIESLGASVAPVIAERLSTAYRETAAHEASLPTLTDMLIARTGSIDPYVRAVALYALGERGAAHADLLDWLSADEHEVVRETAEHLKARAAIGEGEGHSHAGLITIEKMIALRSAPIFFTIAPEGLAELARACREDEYAPAEDLCLEGEPGNEVFILLAGDVQVLKRDGTGERVVATEKAGGFIGEMAVLDPAPRSATLRAGSEGVRVLRLDGTAFRNALNNDPTIASSVIRTLAQRLRQK
ncbi:MAG TPA: cyclic nucleotide-binding domain-containing protein [Pyrinomonadaceae bacterium]|nr:cyclic nucleotide-binding domain-containing protein [Pyrinomonadaceae bacterium]